MEDTRIYKEVKKCVTCGERCYYVLNEGWIHGGSGIAASHTDGHLPNISKPDNCPECGVKTVEHLFSKKAINCGRVYDAKGTDFTDYRKR